ncbi:MAG: hypothetical protein JXR48_00570 [Candidatus Delongbacteria bacterium]|nr:hypothetical protein [Candidatus Delongbacteria bacterium]MBN2833435.1 hypothetical protein [Candidatus Delongbacteria bacterium]
MRKVLFFLSFLIVALNLSAQYYDSDAFSIKKALQKGDPAKAQVIAEDLIVKSSLGIGVDMLDGYVFGYDTFVLKENNLRIFFDDTSATSGFAANDWRITINDSESGGSNYFAIDDVTKGTSVFKIMAGAKNNALFVSSNSRIGINTNAPVLDLHINSSNSPGLRLQQNNSGGWGDYTWDVVGNETNFFIRDVTSGSQLPFRIYPNSPSNTLCLRPDAKVGINTSTPNHNLEVKGDAEVENAFYFGDSGTDGNWRVSVVDGKLTFEKRVSGEWVKKMEME